MLNQIYQHFNQLPKWRQLLVLFGLVFIAYTIAVVASFVAALLLGVDLNTLLSLVQSDAPLSQGEVNVLKWFQVINSICIFFIPTILFSWLKTGTPLGYFNLKKLSAKGVIYTTLLLISSLVPIYMVYTLNQNLHLPASLSELENTLQQMEAKANNMISLFLNMESGLHLVINLLIIAVIPALGEELLFRGTIQKMLSRWWRKPHLAIWFTGALFSFIHFQFYGFLPRMFLGVLFGYVFYWTGNIFYPILLHFLNNGAQVMAVYFGQMEPTATSPSSLSDIPLWILLLGTVGFAAFLYIVQQYFKHEQTRNALNKALQEATKEAGTEYVITQSSDWQRVATSTNPVEMEIAKDMLHQNDVHAVIMNKQDSAYISIGELELYVNQEDLIKAQTLLQEKDLLR